MLIAGFALAGVGALIHVMVFRLESLAWMQPRTRAVFGHRSDEQAEATRMLAFNQGFYNLFLAIEVVMGIGLYVAGRTTIGVTLVFVGAGSMVAAALVLLGSNPRMARAAAIQGVAPLVGIIALVIELLG